MKLYTTKEDVIEAILPIAQLVEKGDMSAEHFSKWCAGYIEALVGWNPVFAKNNDGLEDRKKDLIS